MIYYIQIHNWIPNKSFITNSFVNQFFTLTSAFIFIPTLFIIDLHLHLQVSCDSMYLVSLVLDIRLNTKTVMFLITSRRQNFSYGSLTLLQLPLHLSSLTL